MTINIAAIFIPRLQVQRQLKVLTSAAILTQHRIQIQLTAGQQGVLLNVLWSYTRKSIRECGVTMRLSSACHFGWVDDLQISVLFGGFPSTLTSV